MSFFGKQPIQRLIPKPARSKSEYRLKSSLGDRPHRTGIPFQRRLCLPCGDFGLVQLKASRLEDLKTAALAYAERFVRLPETVARSRVVLLNKNASSKRQKSFKFVDFYVDIEGPVKR